MAYLMLTCNWIALNLMSMVQVAQLLLTRGAQLAAVDDLEKSALHLAAENGAVGVVDLLLRRGADAFEIDVEGQTPLELAQQNQHQAVVRVFGAFNIVP